MVLGILGNLEVTRPTSDVRLMQPALKVSSGAERDWQKTPLPVRCGAWLCDESRQSAVAIHRKCLHHLFLHVDSIGGLFI